MADNVAQQIKNLSDEIARLDKGLENTKALADKIFENSKDIGDALQKSFRKGDDAAKETTAVLKELLKTITDNFGNGKELKLAIGIEKNKLRHDIAIAEDEIRQFGEKNSLQQINDIKKYKQQLAQLADFERTFADINKVINGDKSSNASKEWLERTALSTKEKKALDDATNGYIKQTQAIQDLNRTLDELRQKRAAAEALPVTGVGKKGVSYKTDLSKQSVLGKIDKEIEATETKINNATTAAQKFQAQLIAMQGEKKTKAMSRALGVEEAETEVQKIPTVFDRVIEQINQRAAQSKDKFAKQLINAEALKDEAKNAATQVSHELNYIWRGSQSHLLAAWRNNTGYISEYGRQSAVNQIRLSQEYKSNLDALKTQEVRDKLTQSLTRYKDALQAVVVLEEQQNRSAAQYAAQERAVEGVVRRFNETEQAIAKVRDRWEELNVKKQAGLISEKDFKANTQKLLDEYDRLIAKRKEFETKDIGQSLSERLRRQQEEEKRLEAERVRSAKETSKILTEERGKQALSSIAGSPKMNAAVQQQLKYMQQIRSIGKEINALQANKNRSAEENALLEKRKKELRDILELQKRLNNEQKGSANLARQIDAYNQLRGKVKETTDEVKRQKGSFESMLPTLQRLASAFGVAFSVQGLVQFGKKLVETRGEFEMQFVAMKQIIGDTDEATRIWNQTMQQALQSPFKAMQLVDYTKKLAAYRIETDKLFDTTKRLADVSAGLGVDMGRLILAYGQVKTANYLRASEVRQFTEAGVNIYGNLAKYFSEIEGHAVSTADVVERVSKRMVLFSDVEEIFRRMTSEGEAFFDMQRVQSDTVRGQINKLHDAYDQMLNTIGQANQGTIRDMIDTLNDLVVHWRDVVAVLKMNVAFGGPLVAMWALAKAGMKSSGDAALWFSKSLLGVKRVTLSAAKDVTILGRTFAKTGKEISLFGKVRIPVFAGSLRLAVRAVRTFQAAVLGLKSIMLTMLPFAIFEGIVWLITKMNEASRAAEQLREDLDSIVTENTAGLNEEISRFELLRKKIEGANEGTKERRDLMEQMNLKYGKYLGNINQETASAQELAKAYDQVAVKIRNAAQARAFEQLNERTVKETTDIQKSIVDEIMNTGINSILRDASGVAKGKFKLKITKREAQDIAKSYTDAILSGQQTTLAQTAAKYYGVSETDLRTTRDITESLKELYETRKSYQDLVFDRAYNTSDERRHAEEQRKLYDNEVKAENDRYTNIVDTLEKQKKSRIVINKAIEEEEEKHQQILKDIAERYKMPTEIESTELDSYEKDFNNRLKKALGYTTETLLADPDIVARYERLASNLNNTQQGSTQRDKQIAESWKQATENLLRLKDRKSAGGDIAQYSNGVMIRTAEEVIADAEQEVKDWALAASLRSVKLEKTKSGTTYKSFDKLLSLLKQMNSEYEKLSKSAYGYAKSEEIVLKNYEDAFEEILGADAGNLVDWSTLDITSKQGLESAFKEIEKSLTDKGLWGKYGKNIKELQAKMKKAIADEGVEIGIDVQVRIREDFGRQIEDAIGNYELTLELEKLNLPKGLAADMWGIEEVDLSQLRGKLDELFQGLKDANGEVAADSLKAYEGYLKKIDDLEQKQQRERLKDYAKYIEAQYSDRVKLEMDYVRKVAKLEAETAIFPEQRAAIRAGIDKEYNEAVKKQDWEDFKGSEFYVQMMEDLEKQGTASLEVMRKKLEEMRKNAENLTPRALKEVVNSLEKIDEIERGRTAPLQRLKKALDDLGDTNMSEVYKSLAANQKQLSVQEEQKSQLEEMIMLENERNRLKEQGVTIEEAQVKLSQKQAEEALAQKALRSFVDDGSDNSRKVLLALEQAVNRAKGEREAAELVVQILSGQKEIALAAEGNQYTGKSITELNAEKKALEEQIKNTNNNISAQEDLVSIAKALQQAWYDTFESIKDYAQRIGGIFDGVTETIDYFADSTNSLAAEWREFGNTAVSALSDLVSGIQAYKNAKAEAEKGDAAAGLMSGNTLKLALIILGVIIKIIQAVAKFQDSAIDKEIERSRQRVDELSRAYERLEKSIERTFETADYMANYNEQMQNLREQLAAAEAQISAASQYKDEDKKRDALNSARDAKDQVLDMMDEIEQRQLETFGGIGKDNYRSWAEGFVDAWKDAFLETGDGLDALQDHFDEFLQEWFVKQATMRIAGKALEGVMGDIDKVVSDNGVVDWAELQRIKDQMDLILPDLNDKLTAFAGMWDFGGDGSLSGLAAGIQGMTEEQANILEAYWNSVRMYTASIDGNVSRIAEMLGANGPNSNPMLTQLQAIAANTNYIPQIYNLLMNTRRNNGNGQGFLTYSM